MSAIGTRVTDEELTRRAKELADLLNQMPIPRTHSPRSAGDRTLPGRASGADDTPGEPISTETAA